MMNERMMEGKNATFSTSSVSFELLLAGDRLLQRRQKTGDNQNTFPLVILQERVLGFLPRLEFPLGLS